MSNVSKFWELMKQSVITQALLALMLIGTSCYVIAIQGTLSKELLALDTLILGFYFGSKAQYAIMKGSIK